MDISRLKPSSTGSRHLLIVDDDPGMCQFLQGLADYEGVPCATFTSGEEALASLESTTYGLMLVDIKMPSINGLQFIVRARSNANHASCPVVVLSGHFLDEDLAKVEKSLPNCVAMTKPAPTASLHSVITAVLPPKPAAEQESQPAVSQPGAAQPKPVEALVPDEPEPVDLFAAKPTDSKEIRNGDGVFVVHTDLNFLAAWLTIRDSDKEISADKLAAVLNGADISFGIMRESLEKASALRHEGNAVEMLPVARGIAERPGKDAFLEFHKRPFGGAHSVADDATKIDFKESHAFDNVAPGDLIATLHHAIVGMGGTDLNGRVLLPQKVKDLVPILGENVKFDEASCQYHAVAAGCVQYRGGIITVLQSIEINTDLSLVHGNIRFVGEVNIRGDIPKGFEVSAGGNINIGGTVEGCNLSSEKDISIHGGITGMGRGKIRAKGNLAAKYISEADVICDGDIRVEREIVNSTVYALGRVIIPEGTILGGKIVALRGILAANVGSDLGVATELAAGLHYEVYQKTRQMDDKWVRLVAQQQLLLNSTGKQLEAAIAARDTKGMAKITESMEQIHDQEKQILHMSREVYELNQKFQSQSIPCVAVEKQLYAGTLVIAAHYRQDIEKLMRGPLTIIPDDLHRNLSFQNGSKIKRYWHDGGAPETQDKDSKADKEAAKPAKVDKSQKDAKEVNPAAKNEVSAVTKMNYTFAEIEELFLRYKPSPKIMAGKTILVTDDQHNMLSLISKALQKEGFKTKEAKDGVEALRIMKEAALDCVILDINMPKMSGLQVLAAAKSDPKLSKLPIIACSSNRERNEIMQAMREGAIAYIMKPFNMAELLDKVKEVCGIQMG